jgi:hypothetical protein
MSKMRAVLLQGTSPHPSLQPSCHVNIRSFNFCLVFGYLAIFPPFTIPILLIILTVWELGGKLKADFTSQVETLDVSRTGNSLLPSPQRLR